jgi:serine/threonine protein kinase
MKSVSVRCVEARYLAPMDKGGTSDPYVVLRCSWSKQNFKTKVIDKTLSPKWNEEFNFLKPDEAGTITLKLWDKDKWSSDDFLGQVDLKVADFVGGDVDTWITLKDEPKGVKKEEKPGEIHLVVHVEGSHHKAASQKEKKVDRKLANFYDMGKELGRGAFSIVYRGKAKSDGKEVAIKAISKKNISEEELSTLGREIAIMKKLQHPGIVQLEDIFETDDTLYLVLELVDGGELFDQIVDRGNYSEADAATLLRQVFEAVDFMHSKGIAHRDLKPENLLVCGPKKETVKLADFGLSKDAGTGSLQTSCGTPGYVAPEVLMGNPYTNAVDIWSIGVIAYVLLCGYTPFYSENQRELFNQILKADYEFGDPEWTDISKEAKDFIAKILVVNPNQRPTAQECLAHPWLAGKAPSKSLTNFTSFRSLLEKTQETDKKNR